MESGAGLKTLASRSSSDDDVEEFFRQLYEAWVGAVVGANDPAATSPGSDPDDCCEQQQRAFDNYASKFVRMLWLMRADFNSIGVAQGIPAGYSPVHRAAWMRRKDRLDVLGVTLQRRAALENEGWKPEPIQKSHYRKKSLDVWRPNQQFMRMLARYVRSPLWQTALRAPLKLERHMCRTVAAAVSRELGLRDRLIPVIGYTNAIIWIGLLDANTLRQHIDEIAPRLSDIPLPEVLRDHLTEQQRAEIIAPGEARLANLAAKTRNVPSVPRRTHAERPETVLEQEQARATTHVTPVEQILGLLHLLRTNNQRDKTDEYAGYAKDLVRELCIGLFEQRPGDFALDVDRLERSGRLLRENSTLRLLNVRGATTFLTERGPGVLLDEFLNWLTTHPTIELRYELLRGALTLFMERRWYTNARQLILRTAAQLDDDGSTTWELLTKFVLLHPNCDAARSAFREMAKEVLADRKNLADVIAMGAAILTFDKTTLFLLSDLAEACYPPGPDEALRNVVARILARLDDDEVRRIRYLIPEDLTHLAAQYPNRRIPQEWVRLGRILLIEPSLGNLTMLGAVLRRLKYEVLLAMSADQAKPLLAEKPDLVVITDVMQGTTGIEFIAHLQREYPELARHVVLFSTDEKIASVFRGHLPVLRKPIDLDQFVALLQGLPSGPHNLPNAAALRAASKRATELAQSRIAQRGSSPGAATGKAKGRKQRSSN